MKRSESQTDRGMTTPRSGSTASTSSASRNMTRPSQKFQPHRISRSLAGSQMSLTDHQSNTASTLSLDHLTDSPKAGGYFKQPPNSNHSHQPVPWSDSPSSSTLSLDLAVDHLKSFSINAPLFSSPSHHGSAPDLRSPEANPAPLAVPEVAANGTQVKEEAADAAPPAPTKPAAAVQPDPLLVDDDGMMDSVSARTEALAVCSSFKLPGRGRIRTTSAQGNA